jgi:ABC-type arginine/histidine transport system permease subunit
MEWLDEVLEFLSRVNWLRVVVTVLATAVAIILGIWAPARLLERYTNQVAVRYIWYVMGTGLLIMVYISMYGFGHFWTLYGGLEME